MKRKGKSVFFIVFALIAALCYTAFFGVKHEYADKTVVWFKGASDIRFGIDIRGGVEATFVPAEGETADEEELAAAEAIIKLRLVNLNITDYEVYTDASNDRIIVRFPWREGETEFDPRKAINEIGANAVLTFREGMETDENGLPAGVTKDNIILTGEDIKEASRQTQQNSENGSYENVVRLELTSEGTEKFARATERLYSENGIISIWMDDTMISYPRVQAAITDGIAVISNNGGFTEEEADYLADNINAGSLPFSLTARSFSTISPTLGASSLDVMVRAGIIAFRLVAVFIIVLYRLPGVIATIALLGQVAATIAFISGYFPDANSFTLTLPGIAGVILTIGMGVDANIITAERIKEELNGGKDLSEAVKAGFERGLAPIVDGNITVLIIAIILMGAFGPTDGFFAKLLKPIFFAFGASTAGSIYAFGYTLLVGVILNFVMGVVASRLMLSSISKFNVFQNKALYGYKEGKKQPKQIDFVGKRKFAFTFSGVLIVAIIIASFLMDVKMDIQFKGGALLTYSYEKDIDVAAVESDVEDLIGQDVTVQTGKSMAGNRKTFTISLPGRETVTSDMLGNLDRLFADNYAGNGVNQLEVSNVNPIMGREFFEKSIVALIAAVVLILVYIAFRFRNIGGLPAGAMAVVALFHDLFMIYGVFVFCRFTINGNFIAAMLTILGYSINDTVVIYDRIRENKALYPDRSFPEIVNMSINQSLVRSLNTTITTVLALGTVCVMSLVYGLDSIISFAFPMLVGMISGVYSTVCIAGPLWVAYEERKSKKPVKSNK